MIDELFEHNELIQKGKGKEETKVGENRKKRRKAYTNLMYEITNAKYIPGDGRGFHGSKGAFLQLPDRDNFESLSVVHPNPSKQQVFQ